MSYRDSAPRLARKQIAESTLAAIDEGSYELGGTSHDLTAAIARTTANTRFYAEDSLLSRWATWAPTSSPRQTQVALLEVSTLTAARLLVAHYASPSPASPAPRLALLNFASATKPGGGFLSGAQAQEESLARASTLYPSLMTDTAQKFYKAHKGAGAKRGGFYTHAMVYSPDVLLFRDDAGAWLPPLSVDILTSAAVNAGVVRRAAEEKVEEGAEAGDTEERIKAVMRERMGRVLALAETRRAGVLVLGAFGTGVFENDVRTVAGLWAELLLARGARFRGTFERVVFAIVGQRTFEDFREEFAERAREEGCRQVAEALD